MIDFMAFRHPEQVQGWLARLSNIITRPWTIMEVCGGQTHTILRYGLDTLLPKTISLRHGPGCPVCVTPVSAIDQAIRLALEHGVVLCTYGDMLRVPGSSMSLADARALGADVRVVTTPLQALAIARGESRREVVFFAIGFETTCPGTAAVVQYAVRHGTPNISILMAHVRILPVVKRLFDDPYRDIQGLIAAGHVCAITGFADYHPLAMEYRLPIVVTGFEPVDLLRGIYQCVEQLEKGDAKVQNAYERVVKEHGNPRALELIHKVFEVVDQEWGGLGVIPEGGFRLRSEYEELDSVKRFAFDVGHSSIGVENSSRTLTGVASCYAGAVLSGQISPLACPAFGNQCRPDSPLGAPMVSSEGACAAYFSHKWDGVWSWKQNVTH
jgi:hydrogenase expression/formation protein HypD